MNAKQIFGIILAIIAVIIMFTGVGAVIGVPMLAYAVKNLAVKSYNDGVRENNKKCENERRTAEIKNRNNMEDKSSTIVKMEKNEIVSNDVENPNIQYKLGDSYYIGRKVEKDLKKAFMHYQKAAEKGHVDAVFMIGLMYYRGEGVDKDIDKGIKWIRKSADKDNSDAKEFLKSLSLESIKL